MWISHFFSITFELYSQEWASENGPEESQSHDQRAHSNRLETITALYGLCQLLLPIHQKLQPGSSTSNSALFYLQSLCFISRSWMHWSVSPISWPGSVVIDRFLKVMHLLALPKLPTVTITNQVSSTCFQVGWNSLRHYFCQMTKFHLSGLERFLWCTMIQS